MKLILSSMVIVLLVGCSSNKSYYRGQQQLKNKDASIMASQEKMATPEYQEQIKNVHANEALFIMEKRNNIGIYR